MNFEFNKNGRIARLYRWTYGKGKDQMPDSLCPYFWKSLLALAIFFITWTTYPWGFVVRTRKWDENDDYSNKMRINFNKNSNMVFKRFFLGILLWLATIILSFLIFNLIVISSSIGLLDVLIGLMKFIGYLILICGISILLVWTGLTINKRKDIIVNSETYIELVNMVSQRKDGFMEGYCPRITWKKEEE